MSSFLVLVHKMYFKNIYSLKYDLVFTAVSQPPFPQLAHTLLIPPAVETLI